jgi:membrane protein YdbS with pleckstrin-like domain
MPDTPRKHDLAYLPPTDTPRESLAAGIFLAWMSASIWLLFAVGTGVVLLQPCGVPAIWTGAIVAFLGLIAAVALATKWDRRIHTRNSQGVLIGLWTYLAMALAAGVWALYLL